VPPRLCQTPIRHPERPRSFSVLSDRRTRTLRRSFQSALLLDARAHLSQFSEWTVPDSARRAPSPGVVSDCRQRREQPSTKRGVTETRRRATEDRGPS
jgi:hypothetical protein